MTKKWRKYNTFLDFNGECVTIIIRSTYTRKRNTMCENKTCTNPVKNGCGNWQLPVPLTKDEFNKALDFCMKALKNPDLITWDGEGECPFCEVAYSGTYDEVLHELCVQMDKLIECPLCETDYDLCYD